MGPQDPKDVNQGITRDLTGMVGELAAFEGDAVRWLDAPEYEALRYRLEIAHAAAAAALVEARRRQRKDPGRWPLLCSTGFVATSRT
jgi:hypothetical protein